MKKKIILKEDLHELIEDMPLNRAHALLEDYIASKISNEELLKKYNLQDIADERLEILIPDFYYENECCPSCNELITYRVSEDRKINRLYCFQCEEHPLITSEFNQIMKHIFTNQHSESTNNRTISTQNSSHIYKQFDFKK